MNTTLPIGPVTTISPYITYPSQQQGWICPVCNAGVAPWQSQCPNNHQHALPYNPGQPYAPGGTAPYPWPNGITVWCENICGPNYDGQGNTPMDAVNSFVNGGQGFGVDDSYAPTCQ